MGRHANWIRRPEDPKTPGAWIVWGDRQLPLPRRRAFRTLTGLSIALLLVLGFIAGFAALLAFPFLALGLAVYARPGAREHAALPVLGEDAAFPVTIDVRHNGRRVGRENGWVAFVDGWLVYEGLRTSFSLTTRDTTMALDIGGQIIIHLPERGSVRMFLLTDFMQTQSPGRMRDRKRMIAAFHEWQAAPVPEGEAVLPPREESPRLMAEHVCALLVLTMLAFVLGLIMGTMSLVAGGAILAIAAVCLFVSWLNLQGLRRTLNAALPASQPTRELPEPNA